MPALRRIVTTEEFARPGLADLTVRAALSMHAFGHLQLARGGYVPRVEEAPYKQNEHGWPSVTRSFYSFGGKSDFVEWTSVFGAEKNETLKVTSGTFLRLHS